MTRSSLLGLLAMLLTCPAGAFFSPAVPFFRSPQSPFPSGQAPFDALLKTENGRVVQNFYLVAKDHREYRLPTEQVLRDLDLSMRAVNLKTSEVGLLARAKPPWYEWISEDGRHEWLAAEKLAPDPSDLGLAQTIDGESLRQTPDLHSEPIAEVRAGERFQVLGFEKDFVLVQSFESADRRGFLPLLHVLLKIDFANYVLSKKGQWKPFAFREGTSAVLASGSKKWDLDDIKGVLTSASRGLIAREIAEQGLVPRSVVELKKAEWVQWAESDLKGHGRVFWKKQEHGGDLGTPLTALSTEEILSKRFVSVATHPSHPEEALVSGQGVYWTRDGKSWTKLPNFRNEDLPVAINARGDLFVGGFVSRDQGKTFLPFLRWQDLTPFLESKRRLPGLVRLSEIKTPAPDHIQISIDNGVSKIRLEGSNRYGLVTDWKVLQ